MTGRRLVVPRGARSEVWNYFGFEADEFGRISKSNKRYVICRMCENQLLFSGNTTNLSSHMGRCPKRMLRDGYHGSAQALTNTHSNAFEDLQGSSAEFLEDITSVKDENTSSMQEEYVPATSDESIAILDIPEPEDKQEYCLKWKYHQTNQQSMFFQLLEKELFCDVLIVCEEKFLKAHKLVLSACSSYFEKVLSQFEDRNPVIILRDVKYSDMATLIQFMYKGEVNIEQEQLSSLLEAAEFLKVKGLSDICAEGKKIFSSEQGTADDNMEIETVIQQDVEPSWSGQQSKRIVSNDEEHRPMKVQRSDMGSGEPAQKPERVGQSIEGVVQLNKYLKEKGKYEKYWKEPWVVQAMKEISKKRMTVSDCADLLGVSNSIICANYRHMRDTVEWEQPMTVSQEGGRITLKCNEIASVPADRNRRETMSIQQDIDPRMFVKVETEDLYQQ